MKLLLYCVKANKQKDLLWSNNLKYFFLDGAYNRLIDDLPKYLLNGKIVAECEFEVEEIKPEKYWHSTEDFDYIYNTGTVYYDDLLKKSCLMDYELDDYLGCEDKGYAIHIKNLKIFDMPKELSDYTTRKPQTYDSIICDSCNNFGFDCKKCSSFYDYQQVMKAPQNMMKVCEWDVEDKILISIQPQWLCKILNKEKTIEIRKKVLKEMIK